MATKTVVWSFYLFFGLFHAGKDVFNFQKTDYLIDLTHDSSAGFLVFDMCCKIIKMLLIKISLTTNLSFVKVCKLSSWICMDLLWFLKFQ